MGTCAPIHEDRGCGEHIEEPLGEDCQFEELLKAAEKHEQHGGEQSLDDERGRRRLIARVNVRELAEEEAIARGRVRDARAGHDGSVSVTKMLRAMAAATKPAPAGPATTVSAVTAGRSLPAMAVAGSTYWMAAFVAMKRNPTIKSPPMRATGRERSGRRTSRRPW